jgi:hypothetical protein
MDYMTKLPGVPSSDQIKEGMAFFEGTGPSGQTCGKCIHRGYQRLRSPKWSEDAQDFVERAYRTTACAMFRKLTGDHGPAVSADYHACKYFEAIPK